MPYVIATVLALSVGAMGTIVGLDRERSFYTTVLIVVGSYYSLFAAMGATGEVIAMESALGGVFLITALVGFKKNLWIVVAGLVGHGVFDAFHHLLVNDPGVPSFWPAFCGTYDVVAGAWLAALLVKRPQIPAQAK